MSFIVLFALGFLAVGILFVVLGLKARRVARAQAGWSVVQGRVQSATLETDSFAAAGRISLSGGVSYKRGGAKGFYPRVTYEYEVAGHRYTGNKPGPMPVEGFSRSRAERILAEHRPGSAVTVYYDPADPSQSTLGRSGGGCVLAFMLLIGALCTLAGLALLALLVAARHS